MAYFALFSLLLYLVSTVLASKRKIQIMIPIREGIKYRIRDTDGTGKVHKKSRKLCGEKKQIFLSKIGVHGSLCNSDCFGL